MHKLITFQILPIELLIYDPVKNKKTIHTHTLEAYNIKFAQQLTLQQYLFYSKSREKVNSNIKFCLKIQNN